MPKKKPEQLTPSILGSRIEGEYSRWREIYENGCSDPNWEDGVNLNLVRNHIIYHKKMCEEHLKDNYFLYPDSYFYPEPMEVDNKFMSKDRRLSCRSATLKSTKTIPYSQAVSFDWKEAFEVSVC